ncbi:MAG: hypothetical protein AN484_20985 [Aphanizomenon flos-aquae WA102]|uniref:LamG-like jellyroll fold domain-containing protein n=1 Tax=Aphanizomenon flos-aquae WA102 TaxID=1710896 RepID=A0A1B7WWC4_APHFL|nr:MAG: hypothetical protein AN484_20985 [Aphanizomenon flos-aquae WA102]
MPQLGLGTEIGRVSGGAYDSDALAYFARAGIASGTQTPTAYDNAARFNGTNQFLSIASNSSLTVTGTSFTYAFWANTPNTSNAMVISKTASSDTREFQIGLNTGGVAEFRLFPDGTFANSRSISSSASSFSANSWNFFAYRYDSSAATIGISINGGAFTSLGSIPAITQTNTNPLNLGVFVNTASGLNYTGQLSSIGFWKKALSDSEVTALFNSGAGRTYASLDSGLRTNLISWWELNGTSSAVSLTDSHGVVTGTPNTLTNNGTVTAPNIGPIVTTTQNSRQLINNFVKGIKSLGLWNSMVCWPMRASQNAGAGTTAFSLGGLGQFNGTLSSSGALPTWTPDGLYTSIQTQFVSTNATVPSFSEFSMGAFYKLVDVNAQVAVSGAGAAVAALLGWGGNSKTTYISADNVTGGGIGFDFPETGGRLSLNGGGQLDGRSIAVIGTKSGLTTAGYVFASSSTPTTGTRTTTSSADGAGSIFTLCNRSTNFASRFTAQSLQFLTSNTLTPAQVNSLYSLYKQTLGLGLILP